MGTKPKHVVAKMPKQATPECGRVSYPSALFLRLLGILLFYLASRMAFFWYNHYLFPATSYAHFPLIYRGGLRFDLAALCYLNALWLFLALLPWRGVYTRAWQRLMKGVFVVCNGLGIIAQMIDFVYFRTTIKRTDASFFREFDGQVRLTSIFLNSFKESWPVILATVALLVLLWWGYGRLTYTRRPAFTPWFYVRRSVVFCVVALLLVVGVRGGIDRTTRPISVGNAAAYVHDPAEAALVLNTPFSLIRTVGSYSVDRLSFFDSEQELNQVYSPLHEPNTITAPALWAAEDRPNIVVLILESFSKEHTGYLNPPGHPSYTPFLDSLMGVSYTCMNAYANGKKSIDAIPSILGSLPSFERSFALLPQSLGTLDGLGNTLKALGYHTSFFHGAPNGSMGFDAVARQLGFDAYYGKDQFNDNTQFDGVWGIWDEPFLQFFAQTLNTFEQPFLSAVFTLSSHHPFKVPDAYKGVFPQGQIPIHQCVGYTDNALRAFFETARTMPWFEHTLFIITADHGAYSQLYPEYQTPNGSMAIPILFYGYGVDAGQYEPYAQQIDIMPTVLDWMGYPYPYVAFGRSLQDTCTTPFVMHYMNEYLLLRREKEKEPDNELFLKAFRQQYNNRLLDNRLHGL